MYFAFTLSNQCSFVHSQAQAHLVSEHADLAIQDFEKCVSFDPK